MRLRLLWVMAFGVMVLFGTVGHSAAAAARPTATVAPAMQLTGMNLMFGRARHWMASFGAPKPFGKAPNAHFPHIPCRAGLEGQSVSHFGGQKNVLTMGSTLFAPSAIIMVTASGCRKRKLAIFRC